MKAGQNLTPIRIASPYAYHFRPLQEAVVSRVLPAAFCKRTNSRIRALAAISGKQTYRWVRGVGRFHFPTPLVRVGATAWRVLHTQWRVLHSTALK